MGRGIERGIERGLDRGLDRAPEIRHINITP
jgi:hypothetical protein